MKETYTQIDCKYPIWLIDRVAKRIWRNNLDPNGRPPKWKNLPEWSKRAYRDTAVSVLDVLEFRREEIDGQPLTTNNKILQTGFPGQQYRKHYRYTARTEWKEVKR